MRKLNGKGVVSTKEAFQTKSKSGTQHNAAMAAFSQIDGARSTAQSALRWLAAAHAAARRSRSPPACSGLPSGPERGGLGRVAAGGRRRRRRRSAACLEWATPPPLGHCRHRHDDGRTQEVAASEWVVPPVMPRSLAATAAPRVAGFLP